MNLTEGTQVRMEIVTPAGPSISDCTYRMVKHEGALHALEEHDEASRSPFPYDPKTGREVGNPLAGYGITSRVIPVDGQVTS